MPPEFSAALERLVALARATKGFPGQKPEEATKHLFLRPLLAALGYADSDITPEFHIFQDDCDYLLRSDGEPLLFVEAKSYFDRGKGGSLYDAHREQVRRYLRNYRLHPDILAKAARPVAWLLLANFAQFHLVRVNEDAPTFSFKLDELLPRAAELWELLARERLAAGRIDELYDQELKAGLDARFLADLKRWRLLLANGYGIRNQTASLADLTTASQQLLDRFLFCRMLETHGLIEYNKLARAFARYEEIYSFEHAPTFAEFLRQSLFREIETNFNTELFKQPQLCDTLAIDNDFLAALTGHAPPGPELAGLGAAAAASGGARNGNPHRHHGQGELFAFRHLYSYEFSRMSQDIMGAVYERFLAHRLLEKITPGLGRVIAIEETDELRKKEGIYYTPTYIVDYLVEHTLGAQTRPIVSRAVALIEESRFAEARAAIDELRALRVLDPSMGSGSFLLRAFDHLLAAYGRYNAAARASKAAAHARVAAAPDPLFGGSAVGAGVAEEIPHPARRIATENLFGVDLDAQAVELARLNLWMRLLVAERDRLREALARPATTGRPRNLLPGFANNLKRGNSLIADPDVAGDAAFAWAAEFPEIMANGGFAVVVGNPPYERIQTMAEHAPASLEFLKANYRSAAAGNFDIYVCFVERALGLLKDDGLFGFILPNKFFKTDYGASLRELLAEKKAVSAVLDFGADQVFTATIYTCLLLLSKQPNQRFRYAEVKASAEALAAARFREQDSDALSASAWLFSSDDVSTLTAKLSTGSKRLSELPAEISRGSSSGDDEVFVIEKNELEIESEILRLPIFANAFNRYVFSPSDRWKIIFPYVFENDSFRLYTEGELAAKFPKAHAYLTAQRTKLEARKQFKEWYGYSAPRNLELHDRAHILIPLLANHGMFAHIPPDRLRQLCPMASGGFTITLSGGCGLSSKYLLGLLNSKLLFWRLNHISNVFRGGWITCTKQYFGELPIRLIDRAHPEQAKLHDDITRLADRIQFCQEQRLNFAPLLQQKIRHEYRTPCSLAHYLSPRYADALTEEKLIDDVQRRGFVQGIELAAEADGALVLTARVADTRAGEARPLSVLRLRCAEDAALREFLYAGWSAFLAEHARRRSWTRGAQPDNVYRLLVHELEPLVVFDAADAAANRRKIAELLETVGQEAGVRDLAALEREIAATDREIDRLVYALYELTPAEIALVEG